MSPTSTRFLLIVGCLLLLTTLVHHANANAIQTQSSSDLLTEIHPAHAAKRSNIWEFFQSAKDKTRDTARRFCGIFGNKCEKFKDIVDKIRDKI